MVWAAARLMRCIGGNDASRRAVSEARDWRLRQTICEQYERFACPLLATLHAKSHGGTLYKYPVLNLPVQHPVRRMAALVKILKAATMKNTP